MRIWAVANQKGGVGKSTTVVSLAGLLAEAGQRVLMIDLDPHGSLTCYFGHDPDTISHSAYDLFMQEGDVPAELTTQLIRPTAHPNLWLMPASCALATLERTLIGVEGTGLILSGALSALEKDFDYVIIDNSPTLGALMVNAIAAADHLIIPVQTEFLAIKGLDRMLHTLALVLRTQKQPLIYTILPTLFDRRTHASIQAFETLQREYGDKTWRYAIPVDTRFRDASRAGVVPSSMDGGTHGVRAYKRLLADLIARDKDADYRFASEPDADPAPRHRGRRRTKATRTSDA